MRETMIWLWTAALCFAVLAGSYHLYLQRFPHRSLIVVDASAAMTRSWPTVERTLGELAQQPYTVFSVATEKDMLHSWSRTPSVGNLRPRGARNFAPLTAADSHLDRARNPAVFVLTNAGSDETRELAAQGWTIVRLEAD